MDTINFIHLTDLHFQGEQENPMFGFDNRSRARMALDSIEEIGVNPDFFVITGDLANTGSKSAYENILAFIDDICERFNTPVFTTIGNHDSKDGFNVLFEFEMNSEFYYSEEYKDLKLIFLDSKNGDSPKGKFDNEQFLWLEKELDESADKRVLIFFHHPMVTTPLVLMDGMDFETTSVNRFKSIVAGRNNITGIFNGHTHFDLLTGLDGIPAIISGGTAFRIDPYAGNVMRIVDSGGYMIATLRKNSLMVNPVVLNHTGKELYVFDPLKDDLKSLAGAFGLADIEETMEEIA